MSGSDPQFVIDPTRVIVSGDRQREVVGLALRIGDDGIELHVRTGAVTEETIGLDYGDVDEVGVQDDLSYGLVFRVGDRAYEVTNVTASDDEIEAIVRYVRTRMRRARRGPSGSESRVAPDGPSQGATGGDGRTESGPNGDRAAEESSGDTSSPAEELERWVKLNEQGVISDEELQAKKEELL